MSRSKSSRLNVSNREGMAVLENITKHVQHEQHDNACGHALAQCAQGSRPCQPPLAQRAEATAKVARLDDPDWQNELLKLSVSHL